MRQSFDHINRSTRDGTPAGGEVSLDTGIGEMPALFVRWQNGPLVVDGVREEPNGCFVETVIEVAVMRLEYYQSTKFNCVENNEALGHLSAALQALQERTKGREARNVEGTSQV